MEDSPSENMKVQVENRLTSPGAVIDHGSVSLGLEAPLADQLRCHSEQVSEERLVFGSGFFQRGQVLAWDNQKVNRRLRMKIFYSHRHIVFIHDLARSLALNDAAEKAVVHSPLSVVSGPLWVRKIFHLGAYSIRTKDLFLAIEHRRPTTHVRSSSALRRRFQSQSSPRGDFVLNRERPPPCFLAPPAPCRKSHRRDQSPV